MTKCWQSIRFPLVPIAARGYASSARRFRRSHCDEDHALATIKISGSFHNRGAAKTRKVILAGAIAEYRPGLEINPKYSEAYNNRGGAKTRKGDLDGAIQTLTTRSIDPKTPTPITIAPLKSSKGDLDGAIADFDHALAINQKRLSLQ